MHRSFRDPDGFVLRTGGRVLRCVRPHAADDLQAFLSSSLAAHLIGSNQISSATVVSEDCGRKLLAGAGAPGGSVFLEHPPVYFPNYPYEWAPEMLHCAANLTVSLALAALDEGFGLKDATPFNVMFEGPQPIFLDILSFTRRDPLDFIWQPYAQFNQTFVYPLMADRYFGVLIGESLQLHREGLEPERLLALCSPLRRWLPPFLGAVTLSALLSKKQSMSYRPRQARDAAEARFVLARLLHQAERLADRAVRPAVRPSALRHWADYMDSGHRYADEEMAAKERFVTEMLERFKPGSVLDIGANTGHFSLRAAQAGARVVAIDQSPEAVGALWRTARDAGANVLPLVIDIARPPGSLGWNNSEQLAFLDRARGRFDCVLMLALIHHLIVNERVPMARIFDLAADLTTRYLVVEYVDPADAQFQRILRGREALHRDLSPASFETAVAERFEIVESKPVTPTRRIYALERK